MTKTQEPPISPLILVDVVNFVLWNWFSGSGNTCLGPMWHLDWFYPALLMTEGDRYSGRWLGVPAGTWVRQLLSLTPEEWDRAV